MFHTAPQVKEIFVNLADPRAELARRGISVSKLMKEGTIQIADAGSLRRVLKDSEWRRDAPYRNAMTI